MSMTDVLASALRGEGSALWRLSQATDLSTAVDVAARFGIEPLIRKVLQDRGEWSNVPATVRAAFDAAAHREVAIEALRHRELTRVLAAMGAAGIETLVLKGAAVAHTHYKAAYLRARSDTDLLIRPADRDAATGALETLGYRRRLSVTSDAIIRQAVFERREVSFVHVIDLHWAISNRPLFAEMLSFDELRAGAVAIPALGAAAWCPGPVHTLLFACIHRVAHHDDSPNPLWLYDMKLIAERLTPDDWTRLWSLASDKRIVAVCREGLQLSAQVVGGPALTGQIALSRADDRVEPSVAYIGGTGSPLRSLWLNVRDTGGFQAKVRFLAAYTFPDGVYMRTAYGARGPFSMTTAYARRAWTGLRRLILSESADGSEL